MDKKKTVVVAKEDGFLNVDLEVGARTRAQLAPLIEQLKDELLEMYLGRIRGLRGRLVFTAYHDAAFRRSTAVRKRRRA